MAADRDLTHFFTEQGALCGARVAYRWSLLQSSTTCAACRELLEAREQYEAEAKARRVAPPGVARRLRPRTGSS